MALMDRIKEKAKKVDKHIVLPEGVEPRVVEAASIITKDGIARVTLLGPVETVKGIAADNNLDLSGIEIIDPETSDKRQHYADELYKLREHRGMTHEKAYDTVKHPMYFGTMMVKLEDADGMVGGALYSTADTLLPGLQIIKAAPGVYTVSSCFIMEVEDKSFGDDGIMIFGDCVINVDPNEEQLADIAIASATTARTLAGLEPRIAMLSFSTKGSAKHLFVSKVSTATQYAKMMAPDLNIDGELQVDAALVATVGNLKSPGSSVAGHANVLIFPDLQSGNIGYKLVQRLTGARAIGPICQGFARPINDLSRGCSVDDVVSVVAVTALQAHG